MNHGIVYLFWQEREDKEKKQNNIKFMKYITQIFGRTLLLHGLCATIKA